MISEGQQEQASLHALGLLDADEAAAFERELASNPELQNLVRELRETAASLAHMAEELFDEPAPELRDRVLGQVAQVAKPTAGPVMLKTPPATAVSDKVIRPHFGWVPWALAAILLGCSVLLALDHFVLLHQIGETQRLVGAKIPITSPGDALSQVSFCELEPTPDTTVRPRAAVLWDAAEAKGVLRVTQLAPPAAGKDYQLWAVKAGQKAPVNAGVVHLDAGGQASVPFQPDTIPGDNKVVALALSVEQAGGSPTNQGPILFLGKF